MLEKMLLDPVSGRPMVWATDIYTGYGAGYIEEHANWATGEDLEYRSIGQWFDLASGNPPYQARRRGRSTTAIPVYPEFLQDTYRVAKCSMMVTPARFLFRAGRTPKEWDDRLLSDEHFCVKAYEQDARVWFPDTDIKGGCAVTFYDRDAVVGPVGVFTPYPQMREILQKVDMTRGSLAGICHVATKFDLDVLVRDYPQYAKRERRMSSNVLSFVCFTEERQDTDDIGVYGILHGKRTVRYLSKRYVTDTKALHAYKVVIPKADGDGSFGSVITDPVILYPGYGFTHMFLGMGCFDTYAEACRLVKYICTRFVRALLDTCKVTQDVNAEKWELVPVQDFTDASWIDWSLSVDALDKQLMERYGLTDGEKAFLREYVKGMT